jgi:hypothetical protein
MLRWQQSLPRRRHPVASQFGMRPPIGRFLVKALWLGKIRKVDLRYTCEGVADRSLLSDRYRPWNVGDGEETGTAALERNRPKSFSGSA